MIFLSQRLGYVASLIWAWRQPSPFPPGRWWHRRRVVCQKPSDQKWLPSSDFCLQGTQGIWCIWEIHQDSEVHQPSIPWNIFEGSICIYRHTLPETNSSPLAPENRPAQKEISSCDYWFSGAMSVSLGGKLGGFCTWQLHVQPQFQALNGTSMMPQLGSNFKGRIFSPGVGIEKNPAISATWWK